MADRVIFEEEHGYTSYNAPLSSSTQASGVQTLLIKMGIAKNMGDARNKLIIVTVLAVVASVAIYFIFLVPRSPATVLTPGPDGTLIRMPRK